MQLLLIYMVRLAANSAISILKKQIQKNPKSHSRLLYVVMSQLQISATTNLSPFVQRDKQKHAIF